MRVAASIQTYNLRPLTAIGTLRLECRSRKKLKKEMSRTYSYGELSFSDFDEEMCQVCEFQPPSLPVEGAASLVLSNSSLKKVLFL